MFKLFPQNVSSLPEATKARAKAQARQNDRQLKKSSSAGRRQRRNLSGRSQRMSKSTVLRNARDVLGMGTDLYR